MAFLRGIVASLAVLSLFLCLAFATLWALSYRYATVVTFGGHRMHRVISGGGVFVCESLRLVLRSGNWQNKTYMDTPGDYDHWRSNGANRPADWELRPFVNLMQVRQRAWNTEVDPFVPRTLSVIRPYSESFDNASGVMRGVQFVGGGVAVPYWLAVATTAILPAFQITAWRRHRRRSRLHLCRKCGFDLRASPERCPECGTPVPRDTAAAAAQLPR